jgi:hypothetical protein
MSPDVVRSFLSLLGPFGKGRSMSQSVGGLQATNVELGSPLVYDASFSFEESAIRRSFGWSRIFTESRSRYASVFTESCLLVIVSAWIGLEQLH